MDRCAGASRKSATEKQSGIRLSGIKLSAAAYMPDSRCRIVDAEKGAPLADRKARPYVVDQKTGSRVLLPSPPTVGVLRQASTTPIEQRTHFALFANPERQIGAGDKVTVVIGNLRAEDLIVE